jgi:probable rRNA maturation factor
VFDIEVLGEPPPGFPATGELHRLCTMALASAGVRDGHLAIELVDAERIAELNAQHRGHGGPTDVLSFPIDGGARLAPGEARELGDVVICPAHTHDLGEAVVHGVLHLVGMDHEVDGGEMLSLQRAMLHWERAPDALPPLARDADLQP